MLSWGGVERRGGLVSTPPIEERVVHTEPPQRAALAKWIRRLAVPIILGWLGLIVVLNVSVPQLEEVGKLRAVSMSPKEAPSVIAMMRSGKVFQESDSDSSAMIVLEATSPPSATTRTTSTTR